VRRGGLFIFTFPKRLQPAASQPASSRPAGFERQVYLKLTAAFPPNPPPTIFKHEFFLRRGTNNGAGDVLVEHYLFVWLSGFLQQSQSPARPPARTETQKWALGSTDRPLSLSLSQLTLSPFILCESLCGPNCSRTHTFFS
jgi:hypothetical protein